jgi:hypothetical protein
MQAAFPPPSDAAGAVFKKSFLAIDVKQHPRHLDASNGRGCQSALQMQLLIGASKPAG